jgi:hypothetical protein
MPECGTTHECLFEHSRSYVTEVVSYADVIKTKSFFAKLMKQWAMKRAWGGEVLIHVLLVSVSFMLRPFSPTHQYFWWGGGAG